MINNKICVFDFETDGKNPEECSPVQLSAIIIDPIKLEIIPKSEFNTFLKPEKLVNCNTDNPYTDSDILDWHGKIRNLSGEQVLTEWKGYPEQKYAWAQFVSYLDKYHLKSNSNSKKSQFTAPIAAGYNILRFDMAIVNRLSNKYNNTNKEKETCLFHPRDKIDIMHLFGMWTSYISEVRGLSLDYMRDYLGIDKTNAHNASKDVEDCAQILLRFLRLHKKLSQKIQFKDSFKV
jgi:DNA polymerase III epsilon subunit-like protein